jgi:hypothetical protein
MAMVTRSVLQEGLDGEEGFFNRRILQKSVSALYTVPFYGSEQKHTPPENPTCTALPLVTAFSLDLFQGL